MDRDEVMALSDEELRVKAAELSGWKPGYCRCANNANYVAFAYMPDYPNDLAAAGRLTGKGISMMDNPRDLTRAYILMMEGISDE